MKIASIGAASVIIGREADPMQREWVAHGPRGVTMLRQYPAVRWFRTNSPSFAAIAANDAIMVAMARDNST